MIADLLMLPFVLLGANLRVQFHPSLGGSIFAVAVYALGRWFFPWFIPRRFKLLPRWFRPTAGGTAGPQ